MTGMRGKLLLLSLALAISVAGAQARQDIEKVSPDQSGFTIQPFINGGDNGPANLDPTVPTNNVGGAGGAAAVPEPQTIAMMILGFGCLGALAAFRRRRRA